MKKKNLTAARLVMTALTAAAVTAIFYNSSLSAVDSTQQSSPLTDWINSILCTLHFPLVLTENFIRKAAHFTEYSILGVLLSVTLYLYLRRKGRMLLAAVPAGALIAVCDELIQRASPGRSCQVSDMLLDTCGVIFGALVVWIFILIKEKRRRRKQMNRSADD